MNLYYFPFYTWKWSTNNKWDRCISLTFFLFLQVIVWLIGLVCSTQDNSVVPVEAEAPTVSETVDPSAIASVPTTAERRPKRQFLAGLLIGSLIGASHHHHHGYGYGQSYYGNGYGYGRPYSGYRGYYGCVLPIILFLNVISNIALRNCFIYIKRHGK